MKTVIIHGKRVSIPSPRKGREECELWGVTRCNVKFWGGQLHDWTRWFDIHPLTPVGLFKGIPQRRPKAWHWYREQDGTRPLYLQAPKTDEQRRLFNLVPGAVVFPLPLIQEAFPVSGQLNRTFICQTGMMIAFAVLEGFDRIILNGIGVAA